MNKSIILLDFCQGARVIPNINRSFVGGGVGEWFRTLD